MRTILAVSLLLAVACNKSGSGGAASASAAAARASSSAAPSAAASSTSAAAVAKGEKLDVAALQKALKCPPPAKKALEGPCGVLAEFKDCVAWSPVTQNGDGRWLGRGYRTRAGAFVEELTMLRSKRIAVAEAGGGLPAKIAIEAFPDGEEREAAEKAIHAYERGDVTVPGNAAVQYLKDRKEWADAPAMASDENQVFVATGGGANLCMTKAQHLLVVQPSLEHAQPADGLYAILYGVSW